MSDTPTKPRWTLLLPLVWTAAFLGLAEVGLSYRAHLRGWGNWLFPSREAGASPGAAATAPTFGPTEDFPFRSRVHAPQRPAGAPRWMITSSSHAEDLPVPAAELFPVQLEDLLRKGEPRAQVINASRSGSLLDTHTARAPELAAAWRPELVLLYQMSNDIRFAADLAHRGGLESAAATPQTGSAPSEEATASPRASWPDRAVEQTTMYSLIKTNLTARLAPARPMPDSLGEAGDRWWEARLIGYLDAWGKQGATPVLCTLATSHRMPDLDRVPTGTRNTIFRFSMHLSLKGWMTTTQRWNEVIRRVAAQRSVRVIDLEREVGGRSELFRDFVHFNPKGHARVAQVIADAMRDQTGPGGRGR